MIRTVSGSKFFWHFFWGLALLLVFSVGTPLLIAASDLPSPEEFFGFKVGADFKLLTYEQALAYWQKLETVSPKIKLVNYGKSSQGRPMILAVISSEENIAHLDDYKNIAKRLSLVNGVSEEEAQSLAAQGKAIVWIDGGLHADEVAPAQHIIQLTYDLLAQPSPRTRNILDEVVALLVLPNPDGMDMVADWYQKNLGTPYETSPLVRLYQEYIGHDNNRDSFMLSVPETRNINRIVHHEWYPHIFYNHHQRAPFPSLIFVPPDSEPTNPNLHPLLLRWQNFIGAAIAKAFESEGKQGVISRYLFDTWYPGYVTQVCDFHNIISTFSETFLFHYATPHFYTVEDFPAEYKDFAISLFFTNPWEGGWWRLRNAVEYCLTASKAVLEIAAKYREELLYAKYAMGRETIEKFKREPPYGWIIPLTQWDEGAARRLLNILLDLDIEVYEAEQDFSADGRAYPKGTYVLPTSQPFGRLLKTLFEVQVYPDLRKYPFLWQSIVEPVELKVPPLNTYDVLGWTLPFQMGVKAVPLNSKIQVQMKRIAAAREAESRISGEGSYGFLIPYQNIDCVPAINELLNSGARAGWASTPLTLDGKTLEPGSVIVEAASFSPEKMKDLAERYGLEVIRLKGRPQVQTLELRTPRIALYQPWTENIDEGWTRLILEKHGFRYTTVHNAEIRAGNLRERFDVIILPDETPDAILNGQPLGTVPPEYVGGILPSGARNLKEFADNGGTLVTLGSSSDLAIEEFKLPVRNVLKSLRPEEFFASGLLVRVNLSENHPVTYGLPRDVAGFFAQSPTFQILPAEDPQKPPVAIATYPEKDIVLSGWMTGEKHLQNKAAAVEVPLGKGRIILLGFRVQHRGQTIGTFKLLFNSLYYAAAVSPGR
jgi:hypothetical protein